MVGNLFAVFALAVATPEAFVAEPYIHSARVLPDVHAQIERATESYQAGEWNRTIACSEVVLFVNSIKYKVDFGTDKPKEIEKRKDSLERAMHMWESALENQIRFEETPDAIITITFQQSVTNRGQEVGGHIKWRRDISIDENGEYTPNVKADIWVRTEQPNGRAMSVDCMKHVVGHELGHVLGMNDSSRVGDIMGPIDFRRPTKQLAPDEVAALLDVRARAMALRKYSLVSALQELEGYNLNRAAR